jgi:NADPH-dependent curcumin reductase CurA
MPGMTAYAGLLEIGRPKADRGGRVGVGCGRLGGRQIAKIKGCRAVCIAGGPNKCRFVTRSWPPMPAWIIARATSSASSKPPGP